MICKHGKRVATKKDVDEWANDKNRKSCRMKGDCDCPVCCMICWDGECAILLENPGTEDKRDDRSQAT